MTAVTNTPASPVDPLLIEAAQIIADDVAARPPHDVTARAHAANLAGFLERDTRLRAIVARLAAAGRHGEVEALGEWCGRLPGAHRLTHDLTVLPVFDQSDTERPAP